MRTTLVLLLILLCFNPNLNTQDIQHETVAISIEVPARVFKGDTFVDDLTIDDFELFENGKLQKIEALYLVKKDKIKRKEEPKPQRPRTSRYFVLAFVLTEYIPRLNIAIDYFFDEVFMPDDTLALVTPIKTHHLNPKAFQFLPREKIKKEILGLLRKDILLGNTEYKSTLEHISSFAAAGDEGNYLMAVNRLETLRYINQAKLIEFSQYLKAQKGQKYVFLFYQQELVPQLQANVISSISTDAPSAGLLNVLMPGSGAGFPTSFFKDITFDVDIVKNSFSDSSITMHFLYLKNPNIRGIQSMGQSPSGAKMVEKSGDIFKAFREMAKTTGGIMEVSANIPYVFKRAVDASENYYLLYYTPKDYKTDGKFKNIKVKVKNGKYNITHRIGYFAN